MPEIEFVIVPRGGKGDQIVALDERQVTMLTKGAVDDIGRFVESAAKGFVPRRTGNLFRNISRTNASRRTTGSIEAIVGVRRTAPYGLFVEKGTGIYGPRVRPIRALPGNALVFRIGDRLIFRQSVRGQRGQHYMQRAYQVTTSLYVNQRLQKLAREVAALA